MLKRVSSYEELWSQVDYDRLEIPAQFNLGVACADDNDLEARALTVVSRDQTSHGYTFGDVREQANRLANAVIALGIGRGDVVGVVNPRSFETGVAYMALFRMGGGVALPLSSLATGSSRRRRRRPSGEDVSVPVTSGYMDDQG